MDAMHGAAGDDTLSGGSGEDDLYGEDGNDLLSGSDDHVADHLYGGAGNDTLDGGLLDVLDAGDGDDQINTEISASSVLGGNGNDRILIVHNDYDDGNGSGISIEGGDGDDQVINQAWRAPTPTTLRGGRGNDLFEGVYGASIQFSAGDGHDLVKWDRTSESSVFTNIYFANNLSASSTQLFIGRNSIVVQPGGGSDSIELFSFFEDEQYNGSENFNAIHFVDGTVWFRKDMATWWGTSNNDKYIGTAGNDIASGSFGDDSMDGGAGNDGLEACTGRDTLIGGLGDDTLSGGSDFIPDTLRGGEGNDVYYARSGDTVTELSNQGNDTLHWLFDYGGTTTLGANIENLVLDESPEGYLTTGIGNTLSNRITGNANTNSLDGLAGADTLSGLGGDDTYIVDSLTDVVIELSADGGVDTVQSAVSWTLGDFTEKLLLTGSATSGTGNTLDNTLTGNAGNNALDGGSGNDTLDGGAGVDTLRGGAGDDVFLVDNTADVVTEKAGEGADTVQASVSWTLGSQLENLSLLTTAKLNGTGNTLANNLTGNAGSNALKGLAGNDTLAGGAGADTLTGGTGADTYLFQRGWGKDTVIENDATAGIRDVVDFASGGLAQQDLAFIRKGNNLEAHLASNAASALVFKNWYLGSAYHVEDFLFTDSSLTDADVEALASAQTLSPSPEADRMAEEAWLAPTPPGPPRWQMQSSMGHLALLHAMAGFQASTSQSTALTDDIVLRSPLWMHAGMPLLTPQMVA